MYREEIEDYYSRVKDAIVEVAMDREVVPSYARGFGKRPSILHYPKDVEQYVSSGATSFHGSVERWTQPMLLRTDMRRKEFDELRKGWDLLIDIDCKIGLEAAKKAASLLVKAIESHGVKGFSLKYSGNRGFHIGVPFEAFPSEVDFKPIVREFPRIPRIIIDYLKASIEDKLKKKTGLEEPFRDIEIDSGVISQRHLFRLPYCLHQSTWLVSLPIKHSELKDFNTGLAKPEKVKIRERFLSRDCDTEATDLLRSALYWKEQQPVEDITRKEFQVPTNAVKVEKFPPCFKKILGGMSDGRKRSAFLLVTFLHHVGWTQDVIENFLREWNKRNEPPLQESFLSSTLKSQFKRTEIQLPPNCDHENFYKSIGICNPDEFCERIKNPVTYTTRKVKWKTRRSRGNWVKKNAKKT